MLAVIRIRGTVKKSRQINDALDMVGLKKINSMIIIDESKIGTVRKIKDYVTWGEISHDVHELLKKQFGDNRLFNLKPPRKGLKSIKTAYPKGGLGYRGKEINEFIKRCI